MVMKMVSLISEYTNNKPAAVKKTKPLRLFNNVPVDNFIVKAFDNVYEKKEEKEQMMDKNNVLKVDVLADMKVEKKFGDIEMNESKPSIEPEQPKSLSEKLVELTKEQKALALSLEYDAKTTRYFSHVALGVGALSLVVAVVMAVSNSKLHTEITKLNQSITVMKASSNEMNTNLHLVEFKKMQKKLAGIDPQKNVSFTLQNPPAPHITQPQVTKNKVLPANEKIVAPLAVIPQKLVEVKPAPVVKKVEIKKEPVKLKTAKIVDKKVLATSSKAWTVNLMTFQRSWDAKKNAARMKKQGIPVHVVSTKVKGKPNYHLRVSGFNNKNDAKSFANKLNSQLKLSKVRVIEG